MIGIGRIGISDQGFHKNKKINYIFFISLNFAVILRRRGRKVRWLVFAPNSLPPKTGIQLPFGCPVHNIDIEAGIKRNTKKYIYQRRDCLFVSILNV